ncbi:MAG: DNA-protecting protein DprA [Actinobacteria bacterium]|nr:DNA-protecting protein DprA [Actinomycetota bacterium]
MSVTAGSGLPDGRVVVPGDGEWPPRLGEIGPLSCPKRLYAQGRGLEPETPSIAVVGTRRPTAAGIEAAHTIARGLAEAGFVIVSGLAVGVDAAAHHACVEAGGHTVAVLGCGLDVDYPHRNRALRRRIAATGTIVSEYPAGTQPLRHNFPLRNRIIAGLSLGVVVVEGAITSGALVTARLALDANRTVYAVPGSIRNGMATGPNELIRTSQAALVTSYEDILEDLAPALEWARPRQLTEANRPVVGPDELSVLQSLDDAPIAADRLAPMVALSPGSLAATLARLEVRGLAMRSSGGYVITAAGARCRP